MAETTKIIVRNIPQPDGGRVETGVTRFDGDWAGIFIRGDNAFALAMSLDSLLHGNQDWLTVGKVKGLLKLLRECDERILRAEETSNG